MADSGWAAIPNWLLRDPTVDPKVKMTYLCLSSRVDRDGVCWPSQKLIAREVGCDERTIRRTVRTLREMGLVEVTVKATSHGRSNHYRLLVHPFPVGG